jgi:hypothetical protein
MYEVQHYMVCEGWKNVWMVDWGVPQTFVDEASAEEELDEFLSDSKEAGLDYTREQFRVVRVGG